MDCMDLMKQFQDKYFELAIVDPPYGGGGKANFENKKRSRFGGWFDKYHINNTEISAKMTGGGWAEKYGNKCSHWDIAPPQEYFDELMRVSKNQIIWGGNYFALPPTRCFLVWRKLTISDKFSMAMCEYAWTSFNDNAKCFEYAPQDKARFHPTQKPVALYDWILSKYAKHGDKILDTHAGSASCLVACYNAGFDFIGSEIDEEYYEKANERLQSVMAQTRLF